MKPIISEFLEKEFLKQKARPNQFPKEIQSIISDYSIYYKYFYVDEK